MEKDVRLELRGMQIKLQAVASSLEDLIHYNGLAMDNNIGDIRDLLEELDQRFEKAVQSSDTQEAPADDR